jgi:exodeoxyribonuclease V alpha subunit
MSTYEFLFSYYFSKQPVLAKYAQFGLDELAKGNTVVFVDDADLEIVKNEIKADFNAQQIFCLNGNKITFQRYYAYESELVAQIKNKVSASGIQLNSRKELITAHSAFFEQLFADFKVDDKLTENENINWQKIAVLVAFLNDFSIITGGPGTGKTTTVFKLLLLLFKINPNIKVALSAQTGKAAARIKESLDNSRKNYVLDHQQEACFQRVEPKTLHRLLGYVKNSVDFRHNQQNPLPYDVIIVDESSMIDLPMMAKLMSAVKEGSKLILLGDPNQLPSVELGSVFGDLCEVFGADGNVFDGDFTAYLNSFLHEYQLKNTIEKNTYSLQNIFVKLQRSYRFSSVEGLGLFAQKVLNNESIDLTNYTDNSINQGLIFYNDWNIEIDKKIIEGFEEYLKESDPLKALKEFNKLRVLTSTHEGSTGVSQLNLKIESILEKAKLINPKMEHYLNRPVMVLKNDYNLGLFNGDVGITKVDENGNLKIYFEDAQEGLKCFEPSFLTQIETVYAMTIHKSQGSEFKDALLVLPTNIDSELLNRQIIYTAITRVKEKIYILGEQAVFDKAKENVNLRNSNLKDLLV